MKKYLTIIFLLILFFSSGFIFGTGGINTKPSLMNIESMQKKSLEFGYKSIIEVQTVLKQVEVFIAASQENIEATFDRFGEEQVKIMVNGLVNYKNANNNQSEVFTTNNQSALLDEPPFRDTEQTNESSSNKEVLNNPSDTLTDQQINSPNVNYSPDIAKKALE
jgi:hypothetical protein